ncbi:MAG TPA: hypothetical protein VHI13_13535 [Candidatus Kapabacteria bacterium]|nr:hypothetical protein [Candidatus Kapabacteria bacterium]
MPNAKLARSFGRDVENMLAKARTLGLRAGPERWSPVELAYLRSVYGTMPVKEIAERLKRPRGSILILAQQHGLARKRTRMTKAIERTIMKQIGRVPLTEIAATVRIGKERILQIARANGYRPEPRWRPDCWTPAEDAFLRKHYPTMRAMDIAKHLGRSAQSIQYRTRKLGIPATAAYTAREVHWTAHDESMVRKLYGRIPMNELSKRLGRTEKAIQGRAGLLGLSLRTANKALPQLWTTAEDEELRRLYKSQLTNHEIARKLGRPYGSVCHRAQQFGLKKERPERVEWTAEEDRQLRKLHKTFAPTEIAKRLGRKHHVVRARLYKLGILVRRTAKPPIWTTKEDRLLAKLYGRHPVAEIAERLGRSMNAVKSRAARKGVAKRPRSAVADKPASKPNRRRS